MSKITIRYQILAAATAVGALAAHADEVPVPPEQQSGTSIGVLCALGCAGIALLFLLARKMHRGRDGK